MVWRPIHGSHTRIRSVGSTPKTKKIHENAYRKTEVAVAVYTLGGREGGRLVAEIHRRRRWRRMGRWSRGRLLLCPTTCSCPLLYYFPHFDFFFKKKIHWNKNLFFIFFLGRHFFIIRNWKLEVKINILLWCIEVKINYCIIDIKYIHPCSPFWFYLGFILTYLSNWVVKFVTKNVCLNFL